MSALLSRVIVGGLRMALWESAGPRYTMAYAVVTDPVNIALTNLGVDRHHALHTFARKVEAHRTMVGMAESERA